MKKLVLTVRDDVCQANNKDPNATNLIVAMQAYGDVTPYEKEVEAVKAEYQGVIDNVTAEYNAIKDQRLTEDEIELIKCLRGIKDALLVQEQTKIKALEAQMKSLRDKNELIVRQATAALEQIAKQ